MAEPGVKWIYFFSQQTFNEHLLQARHTDTPDCCVFALIPACAWLAPFLSRREEETVLPSRKLMMIEH